MNIALIGYGKMGKAIEEVIRKHNAHHAKPIIVVKKFSKSSVPILNVDSLKDVDVAIEFTTPLTAVDNLKICMDAGVPVITGTTGWYNHLPEVIDYCNAKNGAFLHAANFSIGVNIFFKINSVLAELMSARSAYSVVITETHHTQKLDAPSGTAIKAAQLILASIKNKKGWKLAPTDAPDMIPITAHRIENVPGTHEVIYNSSADEIKIVHTAHSREGFAEGALLAAQWIHGKKGVFTMNDVLGI
jgi:4-hydroxy-tetrahydrodipicolinate reductase